MTDPLVSIIIPVYNGANYLREAIDSALAQTYEHCEIIVVNDGSTDDSEKIALSYGGRIRYFFQKNGGTASALNYGIANMKGDYFSWLSHDDIYKPLKIAEQVKLAEEYRGSAAIVCNIAEIDAAGAYLRSQRISEHFNRSVRCYLALDVASGVNGCSLLIPKKILNAVSEFQENRRVTQDYFKWFQLAKSFQFVLLEQELVLSRAHPGQDSKKLSRDIIVSECDALHAGFLSQISDDELRTFIGSDIGYFANSLYKYHICGYKKTVNEIIKRIPCIPGIYDNKEFIGILNSLFGNSPEESFGRELLQTLRATASKSSCRKPYVLIYSNLWILGGIERVIASLLPYFCAHYVVFLVYGGMTGDQLKVDCARSFPIPKEAHRIVLPNGHAKNIAQRLNLLASLLQTDIFLGCPNIDLDFLAVYELMRETKIHSIAWNHSDYFLCFEHEHFLPAAEQRTKAFLHADVVAWASEFSAQADSCTGRTVAVMPNPNSFSGMKLPATQKTSGKNIVSVGRLYEHGKRIDLILRVFRKVLDSHPDATLTLVGGYDLDMPIPQQDGFSIRELLEFLHFPPDSVIFKGEQENVEQYYQTARVLLHASESEGFGLVLIEACAHGVPIIAWDIPTYAGILSNGNNALLSPPFDVDAMADSISTVFTDSSLYASMHDGALRSVEKFEIRKIARRWNDLIRAVLNAPSREDIQMIVSSDFSPSLPSEKTILSIVMSYEKALMRLGAYRSRKNILQKTSRTSTIRQSSRIKLFFQKLAKGKTKKLIIFGAGRFGKNLYHDLQRLQIEVNYFADNDSRKHREIIMPGVRCLSFSELAAVKDNALIVIAIKEEKAVAAVTLQLKMKQFQYIATIKELELLCSVEGDEYDI